MHQKQNNNKLDNGQPYNLRQLFYGDRKIIIPDLQRDYCWGDKNHELVSGFIDNLLDAFYEDKNSELQLGMIYAYVEPPNHVQLCDGQQRITTLFLLMGMLYMKTSSNESLKNCLISEDGLKDGGCEPSLQYAIRESTLYFISDLVNEFFLKGNNKVEDIKQSSWYFLEYDFDPSINSLISALEILENKLNGKELIEFSEFIMEKIQFFYFGMDNREHGEEMFVIINTTGEPLTSTENLKPILIGSIEDANDRKVQSEIWEEWEKWFWKKRGKDENKADEGLNDFFTWYWQIKLLQEKKWIDKKSYPLNPVSLFTKVPDRTKEEEEDTEIDQKQWQLYKTINEVNKYFKAYVSLIDCFSKNNKLQEIVKTIKDTHNVNSVYFREFPINVLLPLIEFIVKFPDNEIYPFLRRLRKNYFDGVFDERNHNYVDWRHILQIIGRCKKIEDVFTFFVASDNTFKTIPNINCNVANWYNIEEQIKTNLKQSISLKIEQWEDLIDFQGDLSPLFRIILIYKGLINVEDERHLVKIDIPRITDITASEIEKAYSMLNKLFTSENIELRNRFNLLVFRFSRNPASTGNYSFGRKYMNYFRQGFDSKKVIYQNWFYKVVFNIYDKKNDEDILVYLKECNRNVLKYYRSIADGDSSMQFMDEGSIDGSERTFSIESFLKNFNRPSTIDNWYQRRHYIHWLGYVWYYFQMLKLTGENKHIDNIRKEIIYDTYNQDENSPEFKLLGNQFLRPWTKATSYIPLFSNIQNEYPKDLRSISENDSQMNEILVNEFRGKI